MILRPGRLMSRGSGGATYTNLVAGESLHSAFTITNANGTRRNASGLIETVSANTPRFDYDASGNYLGLLIEESRTNLLLHSNDFTQSVWVPGTVNVTVNGDVIADGGNSDDYLRQNITVANDSATYAAQVELEKTVGAANFPAVQIVFLGGTVATGYVVVNTNTGEITTASGGVADSKVSDAGTHWRVWMTSANNSTGNTTGQFRIYPAFNLDGSGVRNDAATGSVAIQYAGFEKGPFATSYIPTTTAAVTRSADDIVCTDLAAIGFNASAWAIFAHFTSNASRPSTQDVFSLTDGGATETFRAGLLTNTNVFFEPKVGGTSQALLVPGQVSAGASGKLAVGVEANNFAAALDGGAPVTDASGSLPTVTELNIGQTNGISNFLNGHIRTLRYFPQRLPNAQLQSMTG